MEKFIHVLRDKIMYIVLITVLLAFASGILLYRNFSLSQNLSQTKDALESTKQSLSVKESEIQTLIKTKEDLIKQIADSAVIYDDNIAALNEEIATFKDALDMSYLYPDSVINVLESHDFNSVEALLNTLKDHHDLIKVDGILGGTMRWWPENSILINEKYAFGYFEDGHILGYALLEYSFDENDIPVWKVLQTYMQ